MEMGKVEVIDEAQIPDEYYVEIDSYNSPDPPHRIRSHMSCRGEPGISTLSKLGT